MRFFRRFVARIVVATAKEMLEKVPERMHRLEIERMETLERLEKLEAWMHRMSKRYAGREGGRPAQSEQLSLDQIAKGDKDALRKYFAPEMARRGPRSKEN